MSQRPAILIARAVFPEVVERLREHFEVETTPQTFVRKDVTLGLSDGVEVELVSGVTATDRIKVPDTAGPAAAPKTGRSRPPKK